MNFKAILCVTAVLAAVSACSKSEPSANQTQAAIQPSADQQGQIYSGSGAITAIAGDQVSIKHGPIAGIGWPAMTMTFAAQPEIAAPVRVGDQVDFSFRKNGGAYQLTSLHKR